MSTASTSNAPPFACAESTSARRRPNVRLPPAGRAASRKARSDSAIAPASVSMCAASDRSASECARMPATISPAINAAINASATRSARRSPPWSCRWLTPGSLPLPPVAAAASIEPFGEEAAQRAAPRAPRKVPPARLDVDPRAADATKAVPLRHVEVDRLGGANLRGLRGALEGGDGGTQLRKVAHANDATVADGRNRPVAADREIAPPLQRPIVVLVLLDPDGAESHQHLVTLADTPLELPPVALGEPLGNDPLDLLALRRRRLGSEPVPFDLRVEQLADGVEVPGEERPIPPQDEVDVVAVHGTQL